MACLFDKGFCERVRKAADQCVPKETISTRDGRVIQIDRWICPDSVRMGEVVVPVWCSSCSEEVKGPAIRFYFECPGDLVGLFDNWIHQHACRSVGVALDQ